MHINSENMVVVSREDIIRLGMEVDNTAIYNPTCDSCILRNECETPGVSVVCGPWKPIDSNMERKVKMDLKVEISALLSMVKAHS